MVYVESGWARCWRTINDGRRNEGAAACGAHVVVDAAEDSNLKRRGRVDSDGGRSFSGIGPADHDDGVGFRPPSFRISTWPRILQLRSPSCPPRGPGKVRRLDEVVVAPGMCVQGSSDCGNRWW